jgi:hypothetical protein
MRRLVLLLLITFATIGTASAEDPKRAATKLLKDGDRLFKKGDYEAALAKYQKAFETFPSAKIYFPMAQAEEQLGRYIDAHTHYELLLSEAGEPIPEQLRTEAQAALTAVEQKLVTIKFDVRPLGSTITVDNVELGQTPLDKPVRLMPGPHTWSITKDGFMPVEKEMDLDPGITIDETVQLEVDKPADIPSENDPEPKKGPRDVSDPMGSKKTVLIVGIVVTSAALAAATVTGLIAMSEHDKFSDPELSMEDREAARETGISMATTTDILLVSAAIAGGFTIYWYFGQYNPAARAAEHADRGGTFITPYATTDGGGIAVMGRF